MPEPPVVRTLDRRPVDLHDYIQRQPAVADVTAVLRGSTVVRDAATGDTVVVCLELDDPCDDVVAVLRRTRYDRQARISQTPTRSRVFGSTPRQEIQGHDYCTATRLAKDDPTGHATLVAYATRVCHYYQEFAPDLYATHAAHVARVRPEWTMPDSVFTSGIINFNNPLRYHLDAGNVAHVWSNMLVFRDGMDGGFLAVPDYDVAFALPHNSLLMFDGQSVLHGVTPLHPRHADAYRYSVVFYSLQRMWQCLTITDEIARAQSRRWDRELRRAGLKPPDPAIAPMGALKPRSGPVSTS